MDDANATVVELGPDDAADLLALYRGYDRWADRDRGGVERALANSLVVGLRIDDGEADAGEGELIAAARVVTDFAYYATVFDVVVAARGGANGCSTRSPSVRDSRG